MSLARSFGWTTTLLLGTVILLTALPLALARGSSFAGTDEAASAAVTELAPGYQPWAAPLVRPAAPTESLLFSLQAALGSGLIGYFFGLKRGLRQAGAAPAAEAQPQDGAPAEG